MGDRAALFTRGRFSVVEASIDDIPAVAARLRPGDLREIAACGFQEQDAETAIRTSMALSPLICLTGMMDDTPAAMFGVAAAGLLSTSGRPWMLGTDIIDLPAAQRALLAFSRQVADLMRRHYDYLENYVDTRYTAAVRWVRWMGFTLEPPVPYGIHGELFHRFWWKR